LFQIIFAFQTETTHQCEDCKTVYHKVKCSVLRIAGIQKIRDYVLFLQRILSSRGFIVQSLVCISG